MVISKLVLYASFGSLIGTAAVQFMESVSPWTTAFNGDILIVALHGALGGSARWLFLKEPWRDGLRLMLLGAVLAAGLGNLWSVMIKSWFAEIPDNILNQPETAYSGAFVIGLLAVTLLGRFFDEKNNE